MLKYMKRKTKREMKNVKLLEPVITTLLSRQWNSVWHMAQLDIKNIGATAVLVIPGDTIRG